MRDGALATTPPYRPFFGARSTHRPKIRRARVSPPGSLPVEEERDRLPVKLREFLKLGGVDPPLTGDTAGLQMLLMQFTLTQPTLWQVQAVQALG
jgi:hypothetical protein